MPSNGSTKPLIQRRWASRFRLVLLVGLMPGGMLLQPSGCLIGRQFREAALPAIHGGVSQIVDGFIDGVFAAIAVEPDSSASP